MILLLCVDYMYRHKYAIHLTFRFVKLRLEVSIQFIKKGTAAFSLLGSTFIQHLVENNI